MKSSSILIISILVLLYGFGVSYYFFSDEPLMLYDNQRATGKVITSEVITTEAILNNAKNEIKQRAIDVSREIDLYLHNNPEMTLEDLKKDQIFQDIPVYTRGMSPYMEFPSRARETWARAAVSDHGVGPTPFHLKSPGACLTILVCA